MGLSLQSTILALLVVMVVGCTPSQATPTEENPVLISEATLPPATVTPLQVPRATVEFTLEPTELTITGTVTARATRRRPTRTPTREFITLTPPDTTTPTNTNTPSRTPAPTLTRTPTPSRTPRPTNTPTAEATARPTLFVGTITPVGGGEPCAYTWFFVPPPPNCPSGAPIGTIASFQPMQGGNMLGVAALSRIYIVFDEPQNGLVWIWVEDTYRVGETVEDPTISPPFGYYQAQRNFGKVWRNDSSLRRTLGWALTPQEQYTTYYQFDQVTNNLYVGAANGTVYVLQADQLAWWQQR